MKSFFLFLIPFFFLGKDLHAQSLCKSVVASAFALNPQAQDHDYYGVRVTLNQTYPQDVAVVGSIQADDGNPAYLWSLTITAGSLTAETSATYFQATTGSQITVNIQSVNPCPDPNPFTYLLVRDASETTTMQNSFTSLNVDFVELSRELGLSDTLTAQDIDFRNLNETYETDADTVRGVVALFKNNSLGAAKRGFSLYKVGSSYFKPYIVVGDSVNNYVQWFDLTDGTITKLSNYGSANYSFTSSTGSYMRAPGPGCGQAVANCLSDVYSNHGWLSVWATVQSAFLPETVVAFAAGCAAKNCIHH